MSRDLWETFYGNTVKGSELASFLQYRFAGARMEPSTNIVELTKDQGSNEAPALFLRYRDGELVDIDRGPSLEDAEISELRRAVESALLVDQRPQVAREVFFSRPELTRWWRYKDAYQLLAAPPEAPRAGFLVALHPFVVEVSYLQSNDEFVSIDRRRSCLWELGLLLNLLMWADVYSPDNRSAGNWVVDLVDGRPVPKFLRQGYSIDGFQVTAEAFSNTEGTEAVTGLDTDAYYVRPGLGVSDLADVPKVMDVLLDTYFLLDSPERARIQRAAYWLRHASDVWTMSHTAYYLAVINAVEAMLPTQKGESCPKCGLDRSPGPTAQFAAFLERYAPAVGETDRARKDLYAVRSRITHGHRILLSDVPRSWTSFEPKEWGELDQVRLARNLAQMAIVNWLLERASNGPMKT